MEIWKEIYSSERVTYNVSSCGRLKTITSKGKERILNKKVGNTGYLSATIYENGKKHYVNIHRLVAMAFIPNPFNKPTVNHVNGNKIDNRAENLEWATQKEQIQHSYKIGLQKPSDKQKILAGQTGARTCTKVTIDELEAMKKEYLNTNKTQQQVVEMFGNKIKRGYLAEYINGTSKRKYDFKPRGDHA